MNSLLKFYIFLVLLSTLVYTSSCTKNSNSQCEIVNACLNGLIANHEKNGLLAIKMQKVNSEYHYYLETGASTWDGIEYIIDAKCDTICNFGGRRIDGWPPCYKDYDFDKWEVYWKK